MTEGKHTPGPWNAARMVHADTGNPLTPDQIGEYVANSVRVSADESGTTDFLFVFADSGDGPRDICHVGNGPRGPINARLIAAAPDLLAALKEMMRAYRENVGLDGAYDPELATARAAIARAEGEG